MDQNGLFWPKEVYFGPFRSLESSAGPKQRRKAKVASRDSLSLSSFKPHPYVNTKTWERENCFCGGVGFQERQATGNLGQNS